MAIIELLKHQHEFIKSTKQHSVIVGGFRSGKTYAGVIKTIKKLIEIYQQTKTPSNVAYYLPTYALVRGIAYPEFRKQLQVFNIEFQLKETHHEISTDYGTIIFKSMEDPSSIMGFEVGYSLIDEIDRVHRNKVEEAFHNIIARNSAQTQSEYNPTDFVSTPEGFGFLYNFWKDNNENNKVELIRARTENNPYIHPEFVQSLKDQYSEHKLLAYLDGEFVNMTSGSVFSDYDINKHHTDKEVTESDVLHIGMDFNITNMSAVVHLFEGGIAYAVDEFTRYYDTHDLCQAIKQRYPMHRINIYPDASGNNRRSAGESDFTEIRKFKFNLLSLSKNSLVKDRVNTTNMTFRQGKYLVNKNKCPNYSEALMQLAYKNNEPDKSSGFDHLTDAGTYYINYIFNNTRGKVYI